MIHLKSIRSASISSSLVAGVGFAALLYGAPPAAAATAPALGAAGSFSVLAGSAVTNTGATTISGDVGISPGIGAPPHFTGFGTVVLGGVIHDADATALSAQAARGAAYLALDQGCDTTYVGAFKELAGLTLVPGVYCATSFHLSSGTLTLSGTASDVWIFKSTSDLIITGGAAAKVVSPSCDVWWRVVSTATFDANSSLVGNILADTSITLAAGASLRGRALAGTAAVTLSSNAVITCAAAPVGGCPTITIAPSTLPLGRVGVAYSQQLTASGGTGPYIFTVLSGTLPAGLTLSPGGLLSGTPTTPGTAPVTIQATDASGCPGVILYAMDIAGANCPVITVAPATLPSGQVGVAYSQQLTASGGIGPYVFTVLSGALPAGLTLSSGGLVSGTPTTAGPFTVLIQASDANGCPGINPYAIVISVASAGIPTLSGWGLMTLMALVVLASIYRLNRP